MYSFYIYIENSYTHTHTHTHSLRDWFVIYLFVHLLMKHHTSLGHIANLLDTKVVKSAGWGQNPSLNPDSASYFLRDLPVQPLCNAVSSSLNPHSLVGKIKCVNIFNIHQSVSAIASPQICLLWWFHGAHIFLNGMQPSFLVFILATQD